MPSLPLVSRYRLPTCERCPLGLPLFELSEPPRPHVFFLNAVRVQGLDEVGIWREIGFLTDDDPAPPLHLVTLSRLPVVRDGGLAIKNVA
jgi:hypothetical protein